MVGKWRVNNVKVDFCRNWLWRARWCGIIGGAGGGASWTHHEGRGLERERFPALLLLCPRLPENARILCGPGDSRWGFVSEGAGEACSGACVAVAGITAGWD